MTMDRRHIGCRHSVRTRVPSVRRTQRIRAGEVRPRGRGRIRRHRTKGATSPSASIPPLRRSITRAVGARTGPNAAPLWTGAALSRREMNVGFKVIFDRLENFRLAEGAGEPGFSANALLHGLTGLDLAFDKIR